MVETPTLLTARLLLRGWRVDDAPGLEEINADPDVKRFMGPRVAAAEVIARFEARWQEHGFGIWAIEGRQGPLFGALIGFAGVGHATFMPELAERVEIAWCIAPSARGRGFATEAALAARDHAFSSFGLAELIAIIHTENARSHRVAHKLGMAYEQRTHSAVLGFDVDVLRAGAPASA